MKQNISILIPLLTSFLFYLSGNVTAAYSASVLIRNGTVHTVTENGSLKNTDILIEGGQISKLGKNLENPGNVPEIDATSKHITPGLFDSFNQLSLTEVSAVKHSNDHSVEKYKLGPGFDIRFGINPNSTLIPIAAMNGITQVAIAPKHGDDIFAGQGTLLHIQPYSSEINISGGFMSASLGKYGSKFTGNSRSAAIIRLNQAFEEAWYYDKHRHNYNLGNNRQLDYSRLDLEALIPVINSNRSLIIRASRESDIRLILKLKQQHKLQLILLGAEEGWRLADELAIHRIPVIINSLKNLPNSFDQLGSRQDNAAILNKAGVSVSFATGSSHNTRLIRQNAGNAVAHGMPWHDALKAITLHPAQNFGVSNYYGSISAGKSATVVIWDGDPLEITTLAEQVYINGRAIRMESRQTRLRNRYRNLTNDRPFAYQK